MEGFGPDTYGEAFADVYGSWYATITDAEATAAFLHERCAAGPILELGVGDGRLAMPLAGYGRTIIGIDASISMLDRCRQAETERVDGATVGANETSVTGSVVVLLADLAALPITGPIGGALCAFNTLFNLPKPQQQQELFTRVANALTPGAPLVIEATTGRGLAESDTQSVGVSRMSVDRLVLSATVVDHEAQTIAGQHVDITESGIRLRPWNLRWTTPDQLDAMATAAGLELSERFADWHSEAWTESAETHVSVYRRAS